VQQVLALLLVVLGLAVVAVWLTVLELRSAKAQGLLKVVEYPKGKVQGWQEASRQAQEYSLEQLKAQGSEQE
jgi:hypothetical protein